MKHTDKWVMIVIAAFVVSVITLGHTNEPPIIPIHKTFIGVQ